MTKKTKFGWALCFAMCLSAMPASYASSGYYCEECGDYYCEECGDYYCEECGDYYCEECGDAYYILFNDGTYSTEIFNWPGHTVGEALSMQGFSKLPKAERAGYVFKGWYTKKNGGKKVTRKTKLKAKNVYFYAHWKARKFTIKLKTNGKGTVSGGGKKAYKSKVTLKAKPASGYVFDGWYYKGVRKSKNRSWTIKVPLKGATYTAKFVAKKNF